MSKTDTPRSKRAAAKPNSATLRPWRMPRYLLLLLPGLGAFGITYALVHATQTSPPGMVWIPGGEFAMGSDAPDASSHERPAHRVRVGGFWMDETDVTNAQFRRFVEATGYVTTAEKAPTLEDLRRYARPGTALPSQ